MLTIETKELEISDELKRKVEMICKFACTKPTITGKKVKDTYDTLNRFMSTSKHVI